MEAFRMLKYWKSTSIGSGSDDGPFFDLEFEVPDDVTELELEEEEEEEEKDDEVRQKVEMRQNSNENDRDIFNEIQVDGEDVAAEIEEIIRSAAACSKSCQFSDQLVKSATKLRIFMLGLKRSKSESKQIHLESKSKSKSKNSSKSKFMRVRVPIISLLTRATSNEDSDEKKAKKELVQRYLKMVRPFYVKVSKSGKERLNLKKFLGKGKSVIVHSISRNSSNNNSTTSSFNKSGDDWNLQQQDGIQGAILHCKRSFNSSSSSEGGGDETTLVLVRPTSDPSHEEKVAVEVVVVEED